MRDELTSRQEDQAVFDRLHAGLRPLSDLQSSQSDLRTDHETDDVQQQQSSADLQNGHQPPTFDLQFETCRQELDGARSELETKLEKLKKIRENELQLQHRLQVVIAKKTLIVSIISAPL